MKGRQSKIRTQSWAGKRPGFKHELILILREVPHLDVTYQEAERIVEAILYSIKNALLQKENVCVEGFGSWNVVPQEPIPKWKLGKVVQMKPYRLKFKIEKYALTKASRLTWNPHPKWRQTEMRPVTLRGKKKEEFKLREAQQARDCLLAQYRQTIMKFFHRYLGPTHWERFWWIRWNTEWFSSEYASAEAAAKEKLFIESAESVMRSAQLDEPPVPENRIIDQVRWYARWTAQIEFDAELWAEAERTVTMHQTEFLNYVDRKPNH